MRYFGLVCVVALAGCGAPSVEIGRLSEQDIPEDAETLQAVPGPEARAEAAEGGFLARLLGGGQPKEQTGEDAGADFTLADGEAGEAPDGNAGQGAAVETASLTPPETFGATREVEPEPQAPRRGLFGLLSGGGAGTPAPGVTSEIAPGTVLPYGRVARICGLNKRQMGKRVESFPGKRGKYALYDSAPGSTSARTFYLTGFDDGCARQFTAALALFGSVGMHEQLRYGLPAEVHPYSTTDKAYEDLKVKVCKVPRRKPCGARIGRLDGNTVFVSIYERFDSNAAWTNLLLHDGALLAQDKKGL